MVVVPFSTKRLKDRLKYRLKRLKRLSASASFFKNTHMQRERIVNLY